MVAFLENIGENFGHLGRASSETSGPQKLVGALPEFGEKGGLVGLLGLVHRLLVGHQGGEVVRDGVVARQARKDTVVGKVFIQAVSALFAFGLHFGPPHLEVLAELLVRHFNLFKHLVVVDALGQHALVRTLVVRYEALNALLKEQGVLDVEAVDKGIDKLLKVGGQAFEVLDRHVLSRGQDAAGKAGGKAAPQSVDPVPRRLAVQRPIVLNGDAGSGRAVH